MSYHFPAFCVPLVMLLARLCMRFPFGSLRTLMECLSVPFPAGLPGIIGPFPFLAPFLLLPAAVACTVIRLPCCKLPNFSMLLNPQKPNRICVEQMLAVGYSYGPDTVVQNTECQKYGEHSGLEES